MNNVALAAPVAAPTLSPVITDGSFAGLTREELATYHVIIVAFSGGKDSLACLLDLIERGAPRDRIELWHHDVDGQEGSELMDWRCTRDYCRKVAEALGVKLYFSWKVGGFEREMLRKDARTAPTKFETPDGLRQVGGDRGKFSTRRLFPQVSGDLKVRWCSAYLKIDVSRAALCNQERFDGKRVLFVSGERAQEAQHKSVAGDRSKWQTDKGRAAYAEFEPHRADGRDGKAARHIDHLRPVKWWQEEHVWAIIQRHGVVAHPAYRLGWGRVSCAACIFSVGAPDQLASLRAINPEQFNRVAAHEADFGKTIHRKLPLAVCADKGRVYPNMKREDIEAALSAEYTGSVVVAPEAWEMPAGAFGESCGPT